MYDAKLSSRSVIHDSAGSAGRTMAEDLENPEDKVRDNTISVRRSKQFMRTVTAPARYPRRTSHRHRLHRLGGGCADGVGCDACCYPFGVLCRGCG